MRILSWRKVAVFVLAALVALFIWNEVRVEHSWQRYVADARARGVKLLATEFAPPPIPAEENFAALPLWTGVFSQDNFLDPFRLPDSKGAAKAPTGFGNVLKNERIDWVAWQKYFYEVGYVRELSAEPVRDVLTALEHYAPQLAEWSEGLSRPQCRFPLDLAQGAEMRLPHLGVFQSSTKLLILRMRAHLALHDAPAALADFRLVLRGYHQLADEPTLISGLVRISLLAMAVAAVGDGLKDREWGDAELQDIEAELGGVRLAADYRLAMESERGFANISIESMLQMSLWRRALYYGRTSGLYSVHYDLNARYAMALIPRSVYRHNQIRTNRYLEEVANQAEMISGRIDPNRATPSALAANVSDGERYYYFLFLQSAPVYASVARKYVQMQARLDLARLGSALERYRLAEGAYPEKLADLVPGFMTAAPEDSYARVPYRYEKFPGHGFRLYGIGENRRDDGGVTDPGKSESRQLDEVWRYAPTD